MKKTFDKYLNFILLAGILFFSILLQIYLIPNLPNKYFYDSNIILDITNGFSNSYLYDSSFLFTGYFFKFFNVFNFTTFTQWSYLLTTIFSIIIIIFLKKFKNLSIFEWIFIYTIIGLLNIYVFRISKDIIQFIVWMFAYLIVFKVKQDCKKNICLILLFCAEAYFFRTYYIALPFLYFIIYYFFKNRNINILKLLPLMIIGILVAFYLLEYINPTLYLKIINIRIGTNSFRMSSADAITIINDIFQNSSPLWYVVNYFINLIRILFPVELLFKGLKYSFFVVFQLIFTFYLLKSILKKNKSRIELSLISLIISFILISTLFEPDFGSVIRHETATMFIIVPLLFYKKYNFANKKIDKSENNS